MKARIVVVAAVGWYLMVPPQPVGKWWDRPPISKWQQLGSYDSAADCEDYQMSQLVRYAQTAKTNPDDQELANQFVAGKCIAKSYLY